MPMWDSSIILYPRTSEEAFGRPFVPAIESLQTTKPDQPHPWQDDHAASSHLTPSFNLYVIIFNIGDLNILLIFFTPKVFCETRRRNHSMNSKSVLDTEV